MLTKEQALQVAREECARRGWLWQEQTWGKMGVATFDEPSKILVLRAAYYLGESFVRCHSGLHWTVGNVETAEGNMPVVAGFDSGLELAPILIAENLLRVITEPEKLGDIERTMEYWSQKAPRHEREPTMVVF